MKINELISLKNRNALITGATGHLGSVVADTLAQLDADLFLVDRPGSELKKLSDDISDAYNVKVGYSFCDLEQPDERTELIQEVINENNNLNILVNNAAFVGTSELRGWAVPFQEQTIETWRRALEVNLTAAFDLSKGFYPLLRRSSEACIVNIASMYGRYGPDWSLYEGTQMANPAGYAASKGGLIQLTRWLATTLAPDVRVNSVSPGGIFRNQPDVFVKKYVKRTPLGRMATEDDFRGVIIFLATAMSAYVTGQNIEVDGGWGCW